MKTVIFIPARYASTRYPGKPLAKLRQADGQEKSLIEMTWDAAMRISGAPDVYVATDDDRIADHTRGFGGQVVMTSPECLNGTERCAEALAQVDGNYDCVINLQGDAPLTPPWFIEALIGEMAREPDVAMCTPILQVDAMTYGLFREDRKADRVGGTTAVANAKGDALYFSKEVLPWLDHKSLGDGPIPVWHHVGVYGYRPAALDAYLGWGASPLELLEGLEQLRFLYNAMPVRCVPVDARGRIFWELNNPEDVARIEKVLKEQA